MTTIPYSKFKHGQKFTATIDACRTRGEVSKDQDGSVFLCQNTHAGVPADDNRGFANGWVISRNRAAFENGHNSTTNLQLGKKGKTMDTGTDSPEGMKFGVRYLISGCNDPVEFFKTKKGVEARIKELIANDDIDHDSVYKFELGKVWQIERTVEFKAKAVN